MRYASQNGACDEPDRRTFQGLLPDIIERTLATREACRESYRSAIDALEIICAVIYLSNFYVTYQLIIDLY